MNAAEYHDLRFGTRCAFCSQPLAPTVFVGWELEERSYRPCPCAASRAAGPIGMRYENGELRLARMPSSRVEHPVAVAMRDAPFHDIGQAPPWPEERA